MAFQRGDEEKTVQVFAHNDAIGTQTETIWPTGGFITLATGGAPAGVTLTSAGGSTDSGVKITLQGLDGSFLLAEEEVTLGSDGTLATTSTWGRINRAWVSGPTALTGNCEIKSSTTDVVLQNIMVTGNTTGNATFSMPMDYNGYLDSVSINCNTDAEVKLTISIMEWDPVNFNYKVKDKSRIINFKNSYQRQFINPVLIKPGSAVELQCSCSTDSAISSDFVLLLDKI